MQVRVRYLNYYAREITAKEHDRVCSLPSSVKVLVWNTQCNMITVVCVCVCFGLRNARYTIVIWLVKFLLWGGGVPTPDR